MSATTTEPTKNIEAKFNQDDPALKAKVAEFIESAGGTAVAPKDKVEVKPNGDFVAPNPYDSVLTEALVETKAVDVTEEEKMLFVKALLNDVPITLSIKLFSDQFVVQLRSRSFHEQRRIFDVLYRDERDGQFTLPASELEPSKPSLDVAAYVTRQQQYCIALMVQRINGAVFSDLQIPVNDKLEDTQAALHKMVAEKVEPITGIRWTAIMNALRIFEVKCAKLGTEAANQDFWKPRG